MKFETHLLAGPAGTLELRYRMAAKNDTKHASQLAVISHPHPLHGGSMNNKVVTSIETALHRLGMHTLTYNFRGVGQSDGEHDYARGEVEDLMAAVQWGMKRSQASDLHLAGFSFGSFIALQAAQKLAPSSVLSVAPPVGLYDFSAIDLAVCDDLQWHLIQGGQDEVIKPQEVLEWVRSQNVKPDMFWRESASHFFHGELLWLRDIVSLIYK